MSDDVRVVLKKPVTRWVPLRASKRILQGGTILLWGPVNRLRLLSKCKIWGPGYNVNVSEDQQPEFRSLSEIYIIIKQLYSEQTAEIC
jgi:hypothetical protein